MHWLKDSNLIPPRRQIVCLANSRKYGGHCIAGKEYLAGGNPGAWIRPVSKSAYEEISDFRQRVGLRGPVRPLDVISIPVRGSSSRFAWQSENLRLGWGFFRREGVVRWEELPEFEDRGADLWAEASRGVRPRNDRIHVQAAKLLESSLCLIRPRRFSIRIEKSRRNGRRQYRGVFTHREHRYDLAITDPDIPKRFSADREGAYPIRECYLCISLGEPMEGYCYRLIASVIMRP